MPKLSLVDISNIKSNNNSKQLDIKAATFEKSTKNKYGCIILNCANDEKYYIREPLFLCKCKEFISKIKANAVCGLYDFSFEDEDKKLIISDINFAPLTLMGMEIAIILYEIAFLNDAQDEYSTKYIINVIESTEEGYNIVKKILQINLNSSNNENKKKYFEHMLLLIDVYMNHYNKFLYSDKDKFDKPNDHSFLIKDIPNTTHYFNDPKELSKLIDDLVKDPIQICKLLDTLIRLSAELKFINLNMLLDELTKIVYTPKK